MYQNKFTFSEVNLYLVMIFINFLMEGIMLFNTHMKLFVSGISLILITACGGSNSGSSGVQKNNVPPIANAGADQTIKEGETLTLTGTQSSDADGDILAYEWSQSGSAVVVNLGDNTQETLTLDNLEVGNYIFILTVSDGTSSHSDQVNVTVNPATVVTGVIKKTGQYKSYNEYGIEVTDGTVKDDGFYQKGIVIQYTRSSTGVVADHVTGLEWQDDVEAGTVTKPWVTQANYDAGNYFDTSGDTAMGYCENLTLDGGGWRLPTRLELQGIVDYGHSDPAIDSIFENVAPGNYWSFTSLASYIDSGWTVYFSNGYLYVKAKYSFNYVRCVRAGK